MGVNGLESFVKEHVPNGYATVNILDEIDKFKSNAESKPTIIFDVMGFIHSLGGNYIQLLCGGRHNIYLQRVRGLFKSLTDGGAELVFICDGYVRQDNLTKWVTRRRKEYVECLATLDSIQKGSFKSTSNSHYGRCCKSVANSIMLCAVEFGKVVVSNGYDCDAMIAKYAAECNALAVVATDTDFLIYAGDWKYWHAMTINFKNLTIVQFNRSVLLEHLNLTREQMPLFATIVGNDYREEIIYKKRFGGKKCERFLAMAEYVRKIHPAENKLDSGFYKQLYSDLFDSKLDTNVAKDKIEKLKASIGLYNIHFEIMHDENNNLAEMYAKENVFMNAVLSNGTFQYEINFVDLRDSLNNNVPASFIDIATMVFRKLSGIILFDSPDRKFTMLTKRAFQKPYQAKLEEPILPKETIPTMSVLLSSNKDTEDLKWNLLMWSLSFDEDFQWEVRAIPTEFAMIAMTITLLLKNNLISLMEADALMTAEYGVKKKSYNEYEIEQPKLLNARAVQSAHMYNKAMCLIWDALFVCGLKELIVPFEFDGYYFHQTFDKFQMSPDAHSDAIKEFIDFRAYAKSSQKTE